MNREQVKQLLLTILVIVFYVFLGNITFAEEQEKKHPIDEWLERCIEKDSSTAGMINCSGKAYEMWDKELNKVYQKLMKKLTPEERKKLQESQRQWIKFRDAEFGFINDLYLGIGTMIPVIKYGQKLYFVKQRVLQLQEYLSQVEEWEEDRKEHFKLLKKKQ